MDYPRAAAYAGAVFMMPTSGGATIMALKKSGKFGVAALALLIGISSSLAGDAPASKAPPRTVADITQILTSYKPDPKRVEEIGVLKVILESQPPQPTDRVDLAKFYLKKADAASELGALQLENQHIAKVVELGGADNLMVAIIRVSFTAAKAGNIQQALAANKAALDTLPPTNGGRVGRLGEQAWLYWRLGSIEAANQAMALAESTFASRDFANWNLNRTAITQAFEAYRALFLFHQGKYAEAETAARRGLEASRDDLRMNQIKLSQNFSTFPQSEIERRIDKHLTQLSRILAAQGKMGEAEFAAREAFSRATARTGAASLQATDMLAGLILVLQLQGRYREAEQLASACIANLESIGLPADSLIVGDLRARLAEALAAQGRYTEALTEYRKRHAALAAYPDLQAKLAAGDISWSLALLKTGQPDAALAMLGQLLPRSQQWLGEKHLDTMELIGVKAMALAVKGDRPSALDAFRHALPVLLAAAISQGDEPSPLRSGRLKLILEAYLGLLGNIRGTPVETAAGLDAAGEAFRLADALRNQTTQSAVAASALRAAANDPKIGMEIRKEQDLAQEMIALHKILRDLMNAPAEQQLPKVIADMKARIETIKKERVTLQTDIEKRFPAYANLIRPQPPSLAEARAILRPGEALINIFATDTATYLWAFRKDGPVAFATAPLGRDELAGQVQSLRKALDPGDVDLTAGIPDFDLDSAYRLYTELLAPVSAGWSGATHLLVAANGALGQLPLATLPTAKVTLKRDPKLPYEQFKDVPWLIRQAAFTQLPSVNALVALRKLPAANAQRSPFIGFGDPQFTATPIQVASSTRRLRNLSVSRPSQAEVEQAKPVEWMDYDRIPPLPDTRDEILALAQALKADPAADVFLGSHASKANVKRLDLSKRRVVAFATHGLLAGDFPGVSEPSLALANPGGGQHGLLTLEDIMGLKLDADWVVLSACNTAGGDGQGADALSGLGRGFFYAGSRALLVTHWPVESASARLLVTGLFERQAADARLSRAEALRQSMLALMQQRSKEADFAYAHPLFWAPYALVGEGGN
jgi:CHAT domain-containing protein